MYGHEFKELRLEQGITQKKLAKVFVPNQNYLAGKMIKLKLRSVQQ